MRFSTDDQARVAEAIKAAEATTSGEIFCVHARRVSSYRDVSLVWAAGLALILPLALIPLGFEPRLIPLLADGWEAGHGAAREVAVGRALAAYALVQAAVFALAYLLSRIPPILRLLTPRAVRRARCREAALHQFLAHGLHVTEARTGVMIFAAEADHQVEVIADKGIHEKVPDTVWAEAAAALAKGMKSRDPVSGFTEAVRICGEVLAQHFPPRPDNPNELADRIVEI